ncbi:MAG TPA: hypothetical protein VJM50_24000 [Pyrinomonadaceae bacterium]|nr:hypothetical protein [Pyrinomonadaceae bacterium]
MSFYNEPLAAVLESKITARANDVIGAALSGAKEQVIAVYISALARVGEVCGDEDVAALIASQASIIDRKIFEGAHAVMRTVVSAEVADRLVDFQP